MVPFKLRQALRHFAQPIEGVEEKREPFEQAVVTAQMLIYRQEHRDHDERMQVHIKDKEHGIVRKTITVPAIDVLMRQLKRE